MLFSTGYILLGLVLLYFGAEWLVKGSTGLALTMGITPLIVGLTVVAFGTSSPELLVSVQAALDGVSDIAIGNVIGSNICNIGLILGIAAIIRPIHIKKEVFRFDLPVLMAVSGGMVWVMISGTITFANGLFLLSGLILFLLLSYWRSAKEHKNVLKDDLKSLEKSKKALLWQIVLIVVGLIFLAFGAWAMVKGAVELATGVGISTAVIGLTLVAFGTSVPELAATIVASWKKQADFVVGGVIGSNVFNILCILGITAMLVPLELGDVSTVDIWVMIAFSVVIIPIMFTGLRISRWEGVFLVVGYIIYITYLIY